MFYPLIIIYEVSYGELKMFMKGHYSELTDNKGLIKLIPISHWTKGAQRGDLITSISTKFLSPR